MVRTPTIYLVGAIRDDRPEDIGWREQVIDELYDKAVFLNPVGGKVYNPETKLWSMSGICPGASTIVKHDFWCVDKADIIIANLTSMSEGYKSIGSIIELGRASGTGALIYLIIQPDFTGHGNQAMFKLHPFLDQISAATFPNVDQCIEFLDRHLDVLNGFNPHYDGEI